MAYEIIAGRSPSQRAKFGLLGTVFIGKQYIKMDRIMSLATNVYLDVSDPHVILISGKRGSGKSYTLGAVAEGMIDLPPEVAPNLSSLIFDTMGIFWTMKYPNYRDDKLLSDWGLNPKSFDISVYVPAGLFGKYQDRGVPVDFPFAIKPSEIGAEDWADIFGIALLSSEGTLIERAVESAREKKTEFDIEDIVEFIRSDKSATPQEKNAIENRFKSVEKWGLFSEEGTSMIEMVKGGKATVLDLSAYSEVDDGDKIKALVVGLVCKKLLGQRLISRKAEELKLISTGEFISEQTVAVAEEKAPLVWIFIDEAHEFLPKTGKTLASDSLIQVLREGRQPGISLVLATQQPGKIHTDVMTQADIILSHRVTSRIDIDALNLISATYLTQSIQEIIDDLPAEKGSAILLDDKLEKIYPIRVRPRMSWHGGEDPTALRSQLTSR